MTLLKYTIEKHGSGSNLTAIRIKRLQDEIAGQQERISRGKEMTEQYLIKCGGQVYQSDIVTESRLSKSRISSVLSKMK